MTEILLNRINSAINTYEMLSEKLSNNLGNIEDLKKYKQLEQIKNIFDDYKKAQLEINDYKNLINNSLDQSFNEDCIAYINELKLSLNNIETQLTNYFSEKDPNDSKNVIIEIRGAVGGDEANIFAGDLFRMYSHYAQKNNFKVDVLSEEPCEAGGYSFISFSISGKDVYSKLKYESGVHRVQRVPKTEAQGRLHTSTATVLVIPEINVDEFNLNLSEVEIQTCHASGAGGQHINKTSSAIRAIHIPTGITVFCQSTRSQYENKDEALKILASKLNEKFTTEKEEKEHKERKLKLGTGERSEKIRTYNYPQNRVTDHRINFSIKYLDKFMFGDMQEVISALTQTDKEI